MKYKICYTEHCKGCCEEYCHESTILISVMLIIITCLTIYIAINGI